MLLSLSNNYLTNNWRNNWQLLRNFIFPHLWLCHSWVKNPILSSYPSFNSWMTQLTWTYFLFKNCAPCSSWKSLHHGYDWNNIPKKCWRFSGNEFHIKWVIGIHGNWKNQILGAVLELPAKQHCQSSHLPQTWAKLAKSAVLFSW